MKKVIILDKKLGQTPLEAVEKFRKKNKEYAGVKMGYAGRLDPMASGVLVVLVGDENKKIEKYMKLDKEYHAQVLFGFTSDSYDLLGIAKENKAKFDLGKVGVGKQTQELPIYSSYRIKGKPLFWYALHGVAVKIPKTNIEIKKIKLGKVSKISSNKLLGEIIGRIDKVHGNFRQSKVKSRWKKLLQAEGEYVIVDLRIKCSSGTYIRSIANKLGGVLFSLKRTMVGKFRL
jgi:tRNA pseudouridine(55) synthase